MGSRNGRRLTNGSVVLRMSVRLLLGSSGRRGRGGATNLVLGGAGCAHQILRTKRKHLDLREAWLH